jgi:hypothetical protein
MIPMNIKTALVIGFILGAAIVLLFEIQRRKHIKRCNNCFHYDKKYRACLVRHIKTDKNEVCRHHIYNREESKC